MKSAAEGDYIQLGYRQPPFGESETAAIALQNQLDRGRIGKLQGNGKGCTWGSNGV